MHVPSYQRPAVAGLIRRDADYSIEITDAVFFVFVFVFVTATDDTGRQIKARYGYFFLFGNHRVRLLILY